jgi:DNA-binding LytR/AlgR family response regulator
MPGLNGLDLAARLADERKAPRVVFTTAHDAYALQAFEHAAFDYLLKPIRLERLQRTVDRLKETLATPAPAPMQTQTQTQGTAPAGAPSAEMLMQLLRQLGMASAPAATTAAATATAAEHAPAASVPPAAPLQWIRAAQGQETRLIAIDEVIYFQSNDKYTSVFVADGEHLIRTPLRQLREQLDPQQFWQIHRSVIVAARHVAGTRTDFRGRLLVKLKGRTEQLVVSRNYADLFRQM